MPEPPPSPIRRHLLTLSAICALAYGLGLTTHGVGAWHEGQRLLVARQMLDAGEWIVPRINGHPYLAKPPLFCWVQMALASLRGSSVTLLDTRLAVAIFGWLGVLATYLAAREMLEPPPELDGARGRSWSVTAAFWSASMLATGLDYARSARVGELDMLLPALVVTSIWMVWRAWRAHVERGRTSWSSCVVAAIASTLAGLAKGPPALAVIAIGAYGGIALHSARTRGHLRVHPEIPLIRRGLGKPVPTAPLSLVATTGWALMGASVALWFSVPQVVSVRDGVGAAFGAAMAAGAAGALGNILNPTRCAAFMAALSRTHPILVLGLPLLVLWIWVRMVEGRIDPGLLDVWAGEEVDDNLRPFRPASPISVLEAASYGVGLGSVAFFGTLWWIASRGPRLRSGWWVLLSWSMGGLIVFSLFGKGLARYVLPVWPAIAMVGGIGVAELLRLGPPRARAITRGVLVGATVALTVGHAAWYGYGRSIWYAHRSPRDFVRGLLVPGLGVDPSRLATFELYDPGIDFYLDEMTSPEPTRAARTQPVGDTRTRFNLTGIRSWDVEELRSAVARDGPWTVIVRQRQGSRREQRTAIERLAAAGFLVTSLPVAGEYWQDGGDTRLIAIRLDLRASP